MEKNEQQMPRLGEPVPAFEAMTTKGKISFPDDYKGKWVILFSHPADFTPICTTEILTFGARTEEFRALNCELVGLSVDSRNSHIAWLKTIREKIEYKGMKDVKVGFPIIDDVAMKVASLYGMIQPGESQTAAVRAVFFVDPKGVLRAMIYYPLALGRNFDEIRRVLVGLQTIDAFGIALPADWRPGDEVIVPSNTYVASVLAITDNGLVPVFVEPSIHTYNLNTSLVERAVTARTRAIMVVHLYGRVCWDECLKDVAARYGLKIVEDNAQAFGAVSPVAGLQGSFHTGALGNAAGLSFYPTKNLGALGDAGAVTTDDGELAEVVRALGNYGSAERYVNLYKGVNSRMDDLQAAFLSVKLKYLDEDNRRRVAVAKAYSEHIHGKEIVLPEPGGEGEHIWHQYVVRCSERNRLKNYLESEGVGTLIHYPIPPHKQQCYREYNRLPLPIAEQLADEVLSLPMSAYLNESDVLEIARIINRFS